MRLAAYLGLSVLAPFVAACSCASSMDLADGGVLGDAEAGDGAIESGRCMPAAARSWSIGDGHWSTDFAPRGVTGDLGFVVDVAAQGGEIYLSGRFGHAGPVAAHNVAAWSATRGFRALGGGVEGDYAGPIAVTADDTVIVASARIESATTTTYELDAFRGGVWTVIGRCDARIVALELDVDGSVIVSGSFTTIAGIDTGGLARWDGTTITSIATPRGAIAAVLADDHGLCVGGGDAAGGYVMCRAPGATTWIDQAVPNAASTVVVTLVRDATGALLAGGSVDVTSAAHVVGAVLRREGATWTPLGGGFANEASGALVRTLLAAPDGSIWALGDFNATVDAPSVELARAARWDGSAWSSIGAAFPLSSAPMSGAVNGDELIVAGDFVEAYAAHAISAIGIVRWDGVQWRALDQPGATTLGNARASVLAVGASCETYVGGSFLAAGDVGSAHAAAIAHGAWSALGSAGALLGEPHVLAVAPDGTLYAAGFDVDTFPPLPSGLARLRGDAWESFPELANAEVDAIAFAPHGTTYVGGQIAEGILAFDGTSFTPLGVRDPLRVHAMLVTDSGLLVAEGDRLSRWDGASWSVVASGLGFVPSAMIEWNGHIVIGGRFGLVFVRGSEFDAVLFPGLETAQISAMAGVGRQLVVVGRRTTGAAALGIAAWSDEAGAWHDFGFDGVVADVVVLDRALLFAGEFSTVSGIASTGLARLEAL